MKTVYNFVASVFYIMSAAILNHFCLTSVADEQFVQALRFSDFTDIL